MRTPTLRLRILAAILCTITAAAAAPAPGRGPRSVAGGDVGDKARALLDRWAERFEAEGFAATATGPFVIAGDGGPARIARYRDGTVLAAARALQAMYFDKQPAEPVLILLFESAGPYRRLAKQWFDDDDVPHFGFYRRRDNVMLMNVGTGTGTLVHEVVHALIAPDFPDVPDWFNEGLASLYEQCSLADDRITGHENWRLPALQRAIRRGELRPLRELIEDPAFYDDEHVGMNYAQARYLLFYLQEKGLLTDYYRRFREGVGEDPTGLATLRAVLGSQDLEAFEKEWRRWVLKLRFG